MEETTSKFKGCLLAGLLGDCFGAPFEEVFPGSFRPSTHQKKFFRNLLRDDVGHREWGGRNFRQFQNTEADTEDCHSTGTPLLSCFGRQEKKQKGEYMHTDDTAMCICLAQSLVENKDFVLEDVAKKFVTDFFGRTEVRNEYGMAAKVVLKGLLDTEFRDIFQPAKEQFKGMGSFGNGAAMRVAPVALFYKDNVDKVMEVAILQAKITHAHPLGFHGAALQALAVHKALCSDPQIPLDSLKFVSELHEIMRDMEEDSGDSGSLTTKLQGIEDLLSRRSDPSPEETVEGLGNSLKAVLSVPTAIYCFLRGERPLKKFKHDSPVVRTIYFAISCYGDTDTIACMAGSLSGARHGFQALPPVLLKQCSRVQEISDIAEEMANLVCQVP